MKQPTQDRFDVVAQEYDLQKVETTFSRNSYPSHLKIALIGLDSYEQAESIAKEYDMQIELLYKKDGWNFWSRRGEALSPLHNGAEDYGDDYSQFSSMTEREFMTMEVNPLLENEFDSIDDLEEFVGDKRELFEEIEALEKGEIVIAHLGKYVETIDEISMSFSHDSQFWTIGLIDKY